VTSAVDRTPAIGPSLRHRLAERGIDPLLLLVGPAALFTLAVFIYPFLYGLVLSFNPLKGPAGWTNYAKFFSDPFLYRTISTTLGIAIPVTLINVVSAVPIAYLLRRPFRGKRLLSAILVVPLTLGTVFTAEGLLRYLSPNGWFNHVLLSLHLIGSPIRLIHNYRGVVFSLVITGFPFAYLLVQSSLAGIDPSLERAAAMLGAGAGQRFWRVIFPLLLPGLAISCCLNFVLAFSVFPSAVLVGIPDGETRVISIAAYQAAFEQYDYSMASAIAMLMAGTQLVVVSVVLGLRSLVYRGPAGGGKG
jgi:putative spermidine/putrescine transport system permease protein